MLMPYEGLMLLPLYDDFKLADVMPIDYGMSYMTTIPSQVMILPLIISP